LIQIHFFNNNEWEYILDSHAGMTGNSFTNWKMIGLIHKAFIQAVRNAKVHIIITTRAKQDYLLNEPNGRMLPEKWVLKLFNEMD
jgi:hypothetical protein